jgi:multidrug efflux pump subunit AcrA (membrane-fusion protein)
MSVRQRKWQFQAACEAHGACGFATTYSGEPVVRRRKGRCEVRCGGSSRSLRALCAATLTTVLVAGCSGDDTPIVEVVEVTEGEVTQTISAPAVVEAANRQPVAASAPGVVAAIRRRDGQRVEGGDLVVQLVNDDVELALEQAQAAEAAANASRAGVRVDPPGDAAEVAARRSVAELDADVLPDLRRARRRAAAIGDADRRRAAQQTVELLRAAYHDVRDALLDAGRAAAAQAATVGAWLREIDEHARKAGPEPAGPPVGHPEEVVP